jgi:hypothetical protein
MLTDSALLYYAYSGDRSVMDRVREMLDHMLLYGTTEASDSWAQVPYSSSDAGNPVYKGGTDTIYCDQENHTPCGRGRRRGIPGAGQGRRTWLRLSPVLRVLAGQNISRPRFIAPTLWRRTCPRRGRKSFPLAFSGRCRTGTRIREEYTANTIGPIRLLDELLRFKQGHPKILRAPGIWRGAG